MEFGCVKGSRIDYFLLFLIREAERRIHIFFGVFGILGCVLKYSWGLSIGLAYFGWGLVWCICGDEDEERSGEEGGCVARA